jgi:hypothetical protein
VLDKGCDHEKKLVEELLARESAEATPPRDARPLVLRERKPALHPLADGEHSDDAKSDSEDPEADDAISQRSEDIDRPLAFYPPLPTDDPPPLPVAEPMPQEKAPGAKEQRTRKPAHERINSENKPVPMLRLPPRQIESDVPRTPRSGVPGTLRPPLSPSSRGPVDHEELDLDKLAEAMNTPIWKGRSPRATPRPRLMSSAAKREAVAPSDQKIQSARSPVPEKLPESKDADPNQVLKILDSSNEPQQAISPALASQAMEPSVKVEANGPPDNPATAAMPVTLSVVPPAEASATASAPSQPQVLPEIQTEPLSEATPAPRPAGAQWTREQQEMKNRELSVQLMTDLMAKINSSRPNLVAIFEILNKLTAPNLQPYRAESLGGLTLPDEARLHHVNHLMNYIRQDLLPTLSKPVRGRVEAIVEEWQKLDLPRAEARPLAPWVKAEVMVALNNSDLTPPSGLAPGANG